MESINFNNKVNQNNDLLKLEFSTEISKSLEKFQKFLNRMAAETSESFSASFDNINKSLSEVLTENFNNIIEELLDEIPKNLNVEEVQKSFSMSINRLSEVLPRLSTIETPTITFSDKSAQTLEALDVNLDDYSEKVSGNGKTRRFLQKNLVAIISLLIALIVATIERYDNYQNQKQTQEIISKIEECNEIQSRTNELLGEILEQCSGITSDVS